MLLGFIKETAIIYTLGASTKSDIFVFASNLPIILFSVMGTVISTTFMPIYTDIRINNSIDEANSFASKFGAIILGLCITLTLIFIIFPDLLIKIMAPGLVKIAIVKPVIKIVMPSIIIFGITSILEGVLESYNNVEVVAARQIPFNLVLIISMLVIYNNFGFMACIFMILIGALAQLLYLASYSKKIGLRIKKSTQHTNDYLKTSLQMIIPMAVGVMAMQINNIISINLASGLEVGSITKLNIANKLSMASYSALGYLIVILVFPILAEYAAKKDFENIGKSLSEGIVKVLIIMVPVIIILFVSAEDVVKLLFQNNKFLEQDILLTTKVLRGYLLGLIFWAIKDILNRAYYSLKETKVSMKNGIITVCTNIIASLVLIGPFGIVGLALATSFSSIISVILLISSLGIINVKLKSKYIKIIVAKLVLPSIIIYFSYYIINSNLFVGSTNKFELLIKLIIESIFMVSIYFFVLYLTLKKELYYFMKNRNTYN
ncbi:murein biosynthesis integral membrane protein MurJ [Aminipila terrae]|uniref:Lipid II flippase n=1 Tax=Aminipila terrae TaxID=2697030 RepID=A0A6P1MBR0_9FIRM|nr:murein biosynthesis integral membrane protein MurJ [Aminipila terrae]QHI71291.1 murein biosynthesis integral membrane protein MurJ [Aminipila terrae]